MGRGDFRHGRVIYARLMGRNDRAELHPAVIVSPDNEIIQPEDFDPRGSDGVLANLVAVLGVSSHFAKFNDPYIKLPVGAKTGLTKECAVILNWYAIIDIPDDAEYLLGDVPATMMEGINMALRKALNDALTGTLVQTLASLRC